MVGKLERLCQNGILISQSCRFPGSSNTVSHFTSQCGLPQKDLAQKTGSALTQTSLEPRKPVCPRRASSWLQAESEQHPGQSWKIPEMCCTALPTALARQRDLHSAGSYRGTPQPNSPHHSRQKCNLHWNVKPHTWAISQNSFSF